MLREVWIPEEDSTLTERVNPAQRDGFRVGGTSLCSLMIEARKPNTLGGECIEIRRHRTARHLGAERLLLKALDHEHDHVRARGRGRPLRALSNRCIDVRPASLDLLP